VNQKVGRQRGSRPDRAFGAPHGFFLVALGKLIVSGALPRHIPPQLAPPWVGPSMLQDLVRPSALVSFLSNYHVALFS
jgi:hypothetical protein